MPRETRRVPLPAAGPGNRAIGSRSSEDGTFRKEGEYWTIGYGNRAFQLKDTKGLTYLAHLLRHPGTEFHVLDLVGGIAAGRDEHDVIQSMQGLPRGDEELEKPGIHVASLGDRSDEHTSELHPH